MGRPQHSYCPFSVPRLKAEEPKYTMSGKENKHKWEMSPSG